jgi:hypothetical protein
LQLKFVFDKLNITTNSAQASKCGKSSWKAGNFPQIQKGASAPFFFVLLTVRPQRTDNIFLALLEILRRHEMRATHLKPSILRFDGVLSAEWVLTRNGSKNRFKRVFVEGLCHVCVYTRGDSRAKKKKRKVE